MAPWYLSVQTVSDVTVRSDALVVICAGNNYDSVKVADQHVAERLARLTPILYVDPPVSHLSVRKNPAIAPSLDGPRLRQMRAGFWRLTPVVLPFPMRAGMRAVTERLVRAALSRAVASIGIDVRALVTAWPRIDVFGSCGEQVRVWWAQDDFAAGAGLMGQNALSVANGESARAGESDLVVAANPEVAARWRRHGRNVALVPYGSDPESFAHVEDAPRAEGIDLEPPIAALVGQLNDRVQPGLLEAVADRGVSLLLVGPASGAGPAWLGGLAERPNVRWVGGQPFEALPSLLAHASVGLVPYADTPFNRGSFPLKTLEYLAAGLPVVATDLPATRWLGAPQEFVAIADGPRAFSDAVLAAASAPLTPTAREAKRRCVRAHSYEQRAADLLAAIDQAIPLDAVGRRSAAAAA
jgi:teichuronic acid biosynthesis glycosyltransferase TuaH